MASDLPGPAAENHGGCRDYIRVVQNLPGLPTGKNQTIRITDTGQSCCPAKSCRIQWRIGLLKPGCTAEANFAE